MTAMFITKLVLHKCKRFYVRGIETIEICPTMKTQIILGTNGSGKSSLLRIGFTVMPPTKDDIAPGGYKIIHLLGNGNEYELRTIFNGKTPEHHFYFNGEDLNPGRTGATQKELIRQHFNMTQELHDVLTGATKFTAMSNLERRDWITRLSSANFEYVIDLHRRIRKGAKDAGVIIKRQTERYVNESGKKLDDEAIDDLNRRSTEMRARLSDLFKSMDSQMADGDYTSLRDGISYLNGRIETLADRMLDINLRPPAAVPDHELPAIQEQLEDLKTTRKALFAALQEVSDQHQLIDKQMHEISILDDIDPVELQKEIAAIEVHIATARASFRTNLDESLLAKSQQQLAAVDEVMAALHAVVPGASEKYSRDVVYTKQNDLQQLQGHYQAGTSRLSEIEYRLNHIANCKDICCPNCHHTFKEGVDQNEERELRETLTKGQTFKSTMEGKMQVVREFLDEAKDASDQLYELEQLRNRNPGLAGLWNLFGENGGVVRGRELVPLCRDFIHDSEKGILITSLNYDLAPLIEKLNQIEKLDKSGSLRDLHNQLANRIAEIQGQINQNQSTLAIVERYYRDRKEFEDCNLEMSDLVAKQESQFTRLVDFTYNEELVGMVKTYQVSLAMLEQSLTEAEMQAAIVKDIAKTIEETKQEEASLLALEKILSPKDGLIAEQILVFINTFIAKINEVVGSIWGYNLALDTVDLEDGELNYKFPMYVHTRENMIPDIAFGSDSILDIINQAFRLVVYKFMELNGYPLYLDEPARAFDGVHSSNLILAMKDLIDDEQYAQVFYISHDFEGQNSFPNSQIAVLDESHVTLKRKFNEHVVITT